MKISISYKTNFTLITELQAPDLQNGSLEPFIGSDIKASLKGSSVELENLSYQQNAQFLTISDSRFSKLTEGDYSLTIIGLRNAATFSAVSNNLITVLPRGRKPFNDKRVHNLGVTVLNTPGTKWVDSTGTEV